MSNETVGPLAGSGLRVENRAQLDEFLARPDAERVVKSASFEEVFFAIRHIGLADSMDLLPLVTTRQVRGFIDLDCWRKDTFVRKPLMEWIGAFIQVGPEETVRAITGVDEYVLALFLKDLVQVYEVDRDDPPEGTQLILTPDNRFAVDPIEEGEATTIGMLILDALFKYYPQLGTRILTAVRYTSRMELEETAYENKTKRMEVLGFVDYYDALSIYAGAQNGESDAHRQAKSKTEEIPGEEHPGNLPTVFADSLSGAAFLQQAFEGLTDTAETERVRQELTALGNRVLSANLVNLGDLEGVRPALEEMRDTLTIGLELLTGERPERGAEVLRTSFVQTIFRIGFDQMAKLRARADALVQMNGFTASILDAADREFIEALRRFKPLLAEEGRYRSFRSLGEVERARARLDALTTMVRWALDTLAPITTTIGAAFNTFAVRLALDGQASPSPLTARELETYVTAGIRRPEMEIPSAVQPFAQRWWDAFSTEMQPLAGGRIDPRFVETVNVKL